jgi:hypothetical protein
MRGLEGPHNKKGEKKKGGGNKTEKERGYEVGSAELRSMGRPNFCSGILAIRIIPEFEVVNTYYQDFKFWE